MIHEPAPHFSFEPKFDLLQIPYLKQMIHKPAPKSRSESNDSWSMLRSSDPNQMICEPAPKFWSKSNDSRTSSVVPIKFKWFVIRALKSRTESNDLRTALRSSGRNLKIHEPTLKFRSKSNVLRTRSEDSVTVQSSRTIEVNVKFISIYVRDNQRLAFNARRGGKEPPDAKRWLPPQSALKSYNARLAIDYPAYSMVICQVKDKLKLVLLFAVQYLTEWVKITVIFVSYGTLAHSACFKSDTEMK